MPRDDGRSWPLPKGPPAPAVQLLGLQACLATLPSDAQPRGGCSRGFRSLTLWFAFLTAENSHRILERTSWPLENSTAGQKRRVTFRFHTRVCLKMGYTPNYSHLVGIMISKTIGCRGTLFSDKPTRQTIELTWIDHRFESAWLSDPSFKEIDPGTRRSPSLMNGRCPDATSRENCGVFRMWQIRWRWFWHIFVIFIWVCLKMLCTPTNPMVLLIIIPFLNGYFIGGIPYTPFSDIFIFWHYSEGSELPCILAMSLLAMEVLLWDGFTGCGNLSTSG